MQAYRHCSEWMSQNSLLMSCCKEAEDPNKSPQDCVYRSKASTAGRVVGHEADWPRSLLSPLSTSIHPSARERCKAVNSIGLETVFLLQDLSNLQCTRTTFQSFIHSFIHQSIHTCIQCDFFLQVMRSIAIASEACLLRSRVTSHGSHGSDGGVCLAAWSSNPSARPASSLCSGSSGGSLSHGSHVQRSAAEISHGSSSAQDSLRKACSHDFAHH